ncbi:MAG: magnesium transporter CorA family protein, partial [Oscillospiraceae bacterium]|nr:magnesium transporter CorA family protein [Oscillospiraceae bacterium]
KRMTTITIILTMPTIVFSFYGMNLNDAANGLPMANVWFPILLSVLLSVLIGLWVTKIGRFK